MKSEQKTKLIAIFNELYQDAKKSEWLCESIIDIAEKFFSPTSCDKTGFEKLNEKDVCLITYANSITDKKQNPLSALKSFINKYKLNDVFSQMHILPFYPWDTDRGFSVQDFYKVHEDYGTWDDIKELASDIDLMFDYVANHASIDNPIVQKALIVEHCDAEDPEFEEYQKYKNFVIIYKDSELPTADELKNISRPRAYPVLTPYFITEKNGQKKAILGKVNSKDKVLGEGKVWTTFSRQKKDNGEENTKQVDLNFKNPAVFLETVKIVMFYVQQKARLIRLDAVGYIWKELGSICLHEPQCHRILEALNFILKEYAPEVITISEVNERQSSAFRYIGNQTKPEADMAYQFTHFPLAIHATICRTAFYYSSWLRTLRKFGGRQYTTVLGSHDGLGMKPTRGMLPKAQVELLSEVMAYEHSGLPNFAILPGGRKVIYEICATPWCLINNPNKKESFEIQLKRYLAITALGLAIPGIPAIYINGLLGSRNYEPADGLDENRTRNREIFDLQELSSNLDNPDSEMAKTFKAVISLLKERQKYVHFNSRSKLTVLDTEANACVALALDSPDSEKRFIQLVNVSDEPERVSVYLKKPRESMQSLLSEKQFQVFSANSIVLELEPYEICWFLN